MDKWVNSPTFAHVSKVHQLILKHLQNNDSWRADIENAIAGGNKVRAIQTFFESVPECTLQNVKLQVLRPYDLEQMYPHLVDTVNSLRAPQLMYIFYCKDGIAPGQALRAESIV